VQEKESKVTGKSCKNKNRISALKSGKARLHLSQEDAAGGIIIADPKQIKPLFSKSSKLYISGNYSEACLDFTKLPRNFKVIAFYSEDMQQPKCLRLTSEQSFEGLGSNWFMSIDGWCSKASGWTNVRLYMPEVENDGSCQKDSKIEKAARELDARKRILEEMKQKAEGNAL
jgi:hypothetical protein